jgi:DNA-binding XRE family transcriptional regulator
VYPEDLVFAGKAEDEALLQGRKWRPDVTADQTRSRRHEQVERIKARGFYGDRPGTVCLRGLKACRLAASLSQRELAGRIGMSPGTIVQLEKIQHEKWRRRRGAYMKTVKKLCRALDVSPADLICGPEAEGEDTV